MMTSDLKRHPDQEVLERYSLGRLSEIECDQVDDHLLVCERCQTDLLAIDLYIRDMKAACREVAARPAPEPRRILGRLFGYVPGPALAGAFAAVLLMIAVPFINEPGSYEPAVTVDLTAMRSGSTSEIATVESDRPLRLRFDADRLPEAPSFRGEIVNQSGTPVWSGGTTREEGKIVLETAKPMGAGTYWIRLYADESEPLREFGLMVN